MSKRTRRTFTKEFKIQTVKLLIDGQRPLKAVARDLHIDPATLRSWRKQYLEENEDAFPGKGHLKVQDEELYRLKKQLADLQEENDILKKALAIFSK
jgi:transposase